MAGNDRTDRLRRRADELEGLDDDEITGQDLLEAVRVGVAAASGKHQSMSKQEADEITLTDHGAAPKHDSTPAKAKFALAVLDRLTPAWRGPVVVLALGILGVLAWRGGALAGLWP